jgi:hypothetical protein
MMYLSAENEWKEATRDLGEYFITARRKQTLADWANDQPDLQAYARLFPKSYVNYTCDGNGWMAACESWPKPPISGCIRTENGKWVNA